MNLFQRDSSLFYCSHFGYLSTMKLGGVYLSPSCFTISSLQRPPSPQWIANYLVYLGIFYKFFLFNYNFYIEYNRLNGQKLENWKTNDFTHILWGENCY